MIREFIERLGTYTAYWVRALAIESYKLYLEMKPEAQDKKQIEAYIQLMQ